MPTEQSLMERYRERAAQLRTIAEGLFDRKERELIMKCAQDYEELADVTRTLDRANRPFTD